MKCVNKYTLLTTSPLKKKKNNPHLNKQLSRFCGFVRSRLVAWPFPGLASELKPAIFRRTDPQSEGKLESERLTCDQTPKNTQLSFAPVPQTSRVQKFQHKQKQSKTCNWIGKYSKNDVDWVHFGNGPFPDFSMNIFFLARVANEEVNRPWQVAVASLYTSICIQTSPRFWALAFNAF